MSAALAVTRHSWFQSAWLLIVIAVVGVVAAWAAGSGAANEELLELLAKTLAELPEDWQDARPAIVSSTWSLRSK